VQRIAAQRVAIMPEEVDFDAQRVRLILDDLERTTTATSTRPMLRLEREPNAVGGVVVRGLATRMGMIRLGLRIAREALEADTITLFDERYLFPDHDLMTEGRAFRAIQIERTDEPFLKSVLNEPKGRPALWEYGCFLLWLAIVATFVVGLVTIMTGVFMFFGWLWQVVH